MNLHTTSALGPILWFGLGLAVCAMASHIAFSWVELAPFGTWSEKLRRVLGGGASLGTGIWGAHGIGASTGAAAGYEAGTVLALWAVAVAAGTAVLAWAGSRSERSVTWPVAGVSLGTGVVALQMVAVLCGGWGDNASWRTGPLVLAWLACMVGCLAAFAVAHTLHRKYRRTAGVGRMGYAALLAVAVVLGQILVVRAAALPAGGRAPDAGPISGEVLCALALLGSAIVLVAAQQVLRRTLREQSERVDSRRKLDAQSLNDRLTGLPTRQLFEGTLAQATRQADDSQKRLALLFVNLDGFEPINQSFGHLGGDRILREVANRVRAHARPHMAARLAGDEFLLLIAGDDPQPQDASTVATRLIAAIAQPFKIDGREALISCSIGVAMYPEHGARSTMINHAQAAMYSAKASGGSSHAFFEPRMIKGLRDEVDLLRDLRTALERKQIELYYQPKIHAPSGEITGAEALIRWHHPQRGMVSPAVFIPIAERYGLISALGRWVIDEACRQARAWRDDGLRMRIAINLSVHQLRQADLAERIGAALAHHQINPDLITCELTESSAMDDTEMTMRVLGQLDKVGVHISIDDFGTGHSSLSYLRKLPADELKIDRSFVMDLETSEEARKVALAVINLAKALDLKVVAEGVETEGQNRILREFGCDQLQGFLFAKPMSAKALALWAMDDVGPRTMNFRDSLFKETAPAPVE